MAQKENRRKVRAILAGGLVLGVGAVVTLAAWNSSEFATGKFETGAFVLEGKTGDTGFANHDELKPAELNFPFDASEIAAGKTVNAPFAVQLSETTTEDATVTLNTGLHEPIDGLSYKVYTTSGFGCLGLADLILSGDFDGSAATASTFDLGRGDNAASLEQNLCFEVTADGNLQQGATSAITWEFVADQKG